MSLISAKGSEAATSAAQSSVDLTKLMIRLKDGESIKVRLLTAEDYAEYQAISAFDLKVYTQPSLAPLGQKDYFEEAAKLAQAGKVDEKFKKLFPKKRYLIAMADIESSDLRVWDASKGQFTAFLAAVKEYEEIITDPEDELVFNFKRTGSGTETTYSLSPVLKPKKSELEAYHAFDGKEATVEFFESVLQPRKPELQVEVLKEAGFPVSEYFPEIDLTKEDAETDESEVSPLDSI